MTMVTSTEITYPWPLPADAKSVLHFYKHNAIQRAAHEALSAALCEIYFEFASFYPHVGSRFSGHRPEELADLVAGRVRATILTAACVEDPALIENEKRELEILRGAARAAA